jgi:hypothetical protein
MIVFLPWKMSMFICLILCEKLRFCQDFVPITCHEDIMQVSIILHIVFILDSTLSIIKFAIYLLTILQGLLPLPFCSKYFSILGFQTSTIFFVEIILRTHREENLI